MNLLGVPPSDVALTDGGSNSCAESLSTSMAWSLDGLACVTVTIGKCFLANYVEIREENKFEGKKKTLLVLFDFTVFLFTVKDGLLLSFYNKRYCFILNENLLFLFIVE